MRRARATAAEQPAIVATAAAMRALATQWRREGRTIGVVPTMGALHAGHLSLVEQSNRDCGRTVVTIFVNPLQFGPGEDFGKYPRTLDSDLAQLSAVGADAVYTPSVDEMYTPGATVRVSVGGVDQALEGQSRPGHFDGVATVVVKLFNATRPDRAYFGQKDAQQAALITKLARELDTGIEIVVCPIVREPDGLALSSRNAYLSPVERAAATCLSRALGAVQEAWAAGERDWTALTLAMTRVLDAEPLARVDYAQLVDPETFNPPGRLAVMAVRIGATRLIDNHLLEGPPSR